MKTWHVLLLLAVVCGLGLFLAIHGEPSDAQREIGGALVAGVVVGASILLVE